MELSIKKAELAKALALTQSIVERKTTMPILANVLLSADENQLRVSATDLEITAITSVPASVNGNGSTTVSARVLSDIVKELPDGEVTLTLTEGERLRLSCGSSQFLIVGVSAEEFPSLPGISIKPKHQVKAKQLLEMIQKTIYAVSHDETRFNLNGVCLESVSSSKGKGNQFQMVATDGHRLAMVTRPLQGVDFENSAIVPTKGLNELRRLLDEEGDGEVKISVDDGFFVVEGSAAKVSMRLIDGEFPDYNQVLPKKKGVEAEVSVSQLTQALRRAALMVSDKGKCVKLDFSPGKLRISSSSPELGEASEEVDLDFKGEQVSIGFNARYLLDFAASLEEQTELVIELSGELGPARLRAKNDESYFGIVMPMRISS